jgi:LysM repeat protein
MTRISKGILELGWGLAALTLAGCASTPEEMPEQPPETAMTLPAPEEPESAPVESVEATVTPEPVVEAAPQQEPPVLNESYPQRYVVQRGDTLWGLATRYLHEPWRWPELWQKNPKVKNPHLLYPGDVLTLLYVEGRPTLQVQRKTPEVVATPAQPTPTPEAQATPEATPEAKPETTPAPEKPPVVATAPVEPAPKGLPTVKLSPQLRTMPLEKAIPTIPYDLIGQFLSRPRILTEEEIDSSPYIFSSVDEHLSAGAGNRVYVRGLKDPKTAEYVVVRKGNKYVNPDDEDDVLGYEAIHVGNAVLKRTGDPATFDLVSTNREILTGDHIMPAEDGILEQNFMPHSPPQFVDGEILAVQDGVMQIGQYQVVVLNKGAEAGLDVGSVMAVYSSSARVRDTISRETVRLPRERAGTLMVFRVFERVSYALIMQATRPIHINDAVTSP